MAVPALAVIAAVIGSSTVAASGPGEFYQTLYEPAVREACGQQFSDYRGPDVELRRFVLREVDQYRCPDQPPPPSRAWNQPIASPYLQLAVAWTWRVTGVSWDALGPLFALLFSATACAAYAGVRLVAPPLLSFLAALGFALSPLQQLMLPELRDYAKAPFLLAAFALGGVLLKQRRTRVQACLLAAAAGAVVGIGTGFRGDVVVALPLFLVSVVLFWPGLRRDVVTRLLVLAVCVTTYGIATTPLRHYSGDASNSPHLMILGMTSPFTGELGLSQNLYSVGYFYNDLYGLALAGAHAHQVEGSDDRLYLTSPENDEHGAALVRQAVTTFPGDALVRGVAATLANTRLRVPSELRPPVITAAADADASPIEPLRGAKGLGPLLLLAALLVGAVLSLRLTLAVGFGFFYLGGVSSLQWHPRHVFHLEVVLWACAAFLAHVGFRLLWQAARAARRRRATPRQAAPGPSATALLALVHRPGSRRAAVRGAVLCLVAVTAVTAPVAAARAVQEDRVGALLEQALSLPRTPAELVARPAAGGRTLLGMVYDRQLWSGPAGHRDAYLDVHLGGDRCRFATVPVTFRYESLSPLGRASDPSKEVVVHLAGAVTDVHLLQVVFRRFDTRFVGLEVPSAAVSCVQGVGVVQETQKLPLLVDAVLPSDWRGATRHQTLVEVEGRADVWASQPQLLAGPSFVGALPRDLPRTRKIPLEQPAYAARSLRVTEGQWAVDAEDVVVGAAVALSQASAHAGSHVVVEGELREGTAVVGIQAAGAWTDQVLVLRPGPFRVLLTPRGTEPHVVAVEHGPSTSLRMRVDAAYWTTMGPFGPTPQQP